MERIVRAVFEGQDAVPGRLAAADLAKLILGLQAALRRAAHVVLGRPRLSITGRYEAVIEEATRLRFVGTEDGEGSFVGVLALPDVVTESEDLGIDVSFQDLGYLAFQRLVSAVDNPTDDIDPGLARAIGQLADEVNIGGRTSRLHLGMPVDGTGAQRTATISATTRYRMHEIAHRAERRSNILHGRLMEADFEKNRARLRLPDGSAVTVAFGEHLADEIQGALREPNVFASDIVYHSETGTVVGVTLRAIVTPADQPELHGVGATSPS